MDILYASAFLFSPDGGAWLPGTLLPIEGSAMFYIRKPDGKILSVQPDGSLDERDGVGGSYETFSWPDRPLNVLTVTPRNVTYKLAIREA